MTLGHTSFFVQFLCSFGQFRWWCMSQKLEKGLFCNSEAGQNRAPIWRIVVRLWSDFETFVSGKIGARFLGIGLRFQIRSCAIVLRCCRSEHDFSVSGKFPIKGKSISERRVRNFGDKNWLLELDHWADGGSPSKLIASYQFHVMNSSLSLVIYALAMSS